jgi:XTP/dITP diphosphohydrolase
MSRILQPGKIIVASHNRGKIPEISALLSPFGMDPVSAADLGLPEPEETGTTFAENALIKAHSSAKAGNMVALADDSGLCVAALDEAPGVYTANWAETPNGRDWNFAMQRVEQALSAIGPSPDRSAYFACTLALAWPDGREIVFEGKVNGHLVWPPRGAIGFGYDPVFVASGETETFSEMQSARKAELSHRADAFNKLIQAVF